VVDEHQRNYNRAHKRARVTVEHCFGMLKKRFPALLYQLRSLKLSNVQAIIGNLIPHCF
jgi:DDE superfamily endonuclease